MNKSNMFPGLKFVVAYVKKDKESNKLSPDIIIYSASAKLGSRLVWSCLQSFLEWKTLVGRDGFRSTFREGEILDNNSHRASETRGQIYHYAAQLMDHQYRLFVFAASISGDIARFYRFDPSCVAVSEPIVFRENPRPLVDFFVRFATLSAAQRGYDPTVTPANDAEKKLFKACLKEYNERVEKDNLRKHPGVDTLGDNIVKMQVNDDVTKKPHWYLACKPSCSTANNSPCGRLTRGFIATPVPGNLGIGRNPHEVEQADFEKGKLYWLKDCWRSDSVESEANIYRHLKKNNVPNLPAIKYAGDILVESNIQETANDSLLSDPSAEGWRRPNDIIYHMIHYRTVAGLLIPFDDVTNTKELLLVGRDILNSKAL